MNKDVLETQWPQIREILKDKFSNLTEDDIRQINGRYDQLVAKLQQKYGYSREEAEERIRNWNFDRFASNKAQTFNEDKIRRKDDSFSILPWLLGIGIPLLLLGAYFFSTARSPEMTRSPTAVQEQTMAETPADRAISDSVRNVLISQNMGSDIQNLRITTRNGVVTLSGNVSSTESRDAIIESASSASGARQVVNNLQVR